MVLLMLIAKKIRFGFSLLQVGLVALGFFIGFVLVDSLSRFESVRERVEQVDQRTQSAVQVLGKQTERLAENSQVLRTAVADLDSVEQKVSLANVKVMQFSEALAELVSQTWGLADGLDESELKYELEDLADTAEGIQESLQRDIRLNLESANKFVKSLH